MRNKNYGMDRRAPFKILLLSIGCLAIIVSLSSCSANLPVQSESQYAAGNVVPTKYSIVWVIHGDGDYLYHDTSGNEHRADEETLAAAIRVAKQNPQAEVFIFHQRPKQNFLFFFPLRDGKFYYFRNGQLIADETYWRDQGQSKLEPEVALYRRFRVKNHHKMVRMFIYCGHEIPEFGGTGYDASYPERAFTVNDLVHGLKGFTSDTTKFDLTILSTCFGGTPHTIGALGSFSRFIIASPGYLHLSYFDFDPLEQLGLRLPDGDVHAFAEKFAQQSFDRLTKEVQTAVSVAVYDAERVRIFLHSVNKIYDQTLTDLKGLTQDSLVTIEHCDCGDLPSYVRPSMNMGVEVFYRPARFGKLKRKLNHSGWECWKFGDHGVQSSHTIDHN